jgi:alpha-beta hydrolase superfamily lysophospholipase
MGNSRSSSGSFPSDLPHFVNEDGLKIFIRRWTPQSAPRAVLFMCHGVAEHIERYDPLASILAGNGFLVVGHDHGKAWSSYRMHMR